MIEPLSTLQISALPPLHGALVMLLGAYVALELGQRVRAVRSAERTPWWMASALAWVVALCSSVLLGLAEPMSRFQVGFDLGSVAMAALCSAALALTGLHLYFRATPTPAQGLLAAGLLGTATLVAQVLVLGSLGLSPGVIWQPVTLVLAWLVVSAGLAAGHAMLASTRLSASRPQRQMLAAATICVAVLAAQALAIEAAGLPGQNLLPLDGRMPAATVATVVAVGSAELLLLMLLACAVETRLRGTLERARAALQGRSTRDELTALPNRIGFEVTLAEAQRQADAAHGQVALLLVALDGFKNVNESHGHNAGDELLRCMARRLQDLALPRQVARLGGDEFLLLLGGEAAATHCGALAKRVLDAVAAPCLIEGRELDVSATVGISMYPQHGAMAALITHASVAMRAAKQGGGATYCFFDARMMVDTREQTDLLRDLRLAVARGQLELYYQPKIHAPSAQITGAEALLRWHHPTRGMISPTVFIPLAERCGVINALGAWVIDEACRQARAWRDQGLRMRVAVNLSAHQLRQADLPQNLSAALRKHQINPDLLTCEITESVAMEDTEATMRFFAELAAVGVHISIDDFGSGYSSLAYLRKLPASELKIDRSFVLDLENSEEARTIASAVVQLARALNLKVVAEGVETEAQFQILRTLGCDELQGFLFAKPMSAKALGRWAMADEGPRAIEFSEALFQGTREMAL